MAERARQVGREAGEAGRSTSSLSIGRLTWLLLRAAQFHRLGRKRPAFGCDSTTPPSVETPLSVVLVPEVIDPDGEFAFFLYEGHWGERDVAIFEDQKVQIWGASGAILPGPLRLAHLHVEGSDSSLGGVNTTDAFCTPLRMGIEGRYLPGLVSLGYRLADCRDSWIVGVPVLQGLAIPHGSPGHLWERAQNIPGDRRAGDPDWVRGLAGVRIPVRYSVIRMDRPNVQFVDQQENRSDSGGGKSGHARHVPGCNASRGLCDEGYPARGSNQGLAILPGAINFICADGANCCGLRDCVHRFPPSRWC